MCKKFINYSLEAKSYNLGQVTIRSVTMICPLVYLLLMVCNQIGVQVTDAETTNHVTAANEVAVIVSGVGLAGAPVYSVELYMGHLPDQLKCTETGQLPTVTDFPVPVQGASAVFLPDFGIYVCGGKNLETSEKEKACYNYNPAISR